MKKKLIIGIVFILLCVFINVYSVEAYSGEIDPENYITLPTTIYINNGIGEGTIYLSSNANEYNISYQKIDITESSYNSLNDKHDEVNEYIEENNKILKEKEANLKTLKTEFDTLYNSGTATTEQLTEAQNKFNEAYEDFEEFYNTMSTNITTLQNEFLALVPDYTNSWTSTTNNSDNVQLDFKNYTGKAYFILWAKIENGINTYYDLNLYAPIIPEEEKVTISKTSTSVNVDETVQLTATSSKDSKITWTSNDNSIATVDANGLVKGIKQGTVVITAKGSEKTATCTITVNAKTTTEPDDDKAGADDEKVEWTDFSNAKFELKKDGDSGAIVEISNVTPKEGRDYYLFITSNNSKPNVTWDDEERISLNYDSNNKVFKTFQSAEVAKYVEQNQDLYVTILEKEYLLGEEKVVVYGKKLERYAEPKYSDAFFATHMTNDTDQLVTTFTHSKENNRKIQIKVGKITDESILKKIKNQDSSGFSSLLSFAKSSDGIYNKTVDADKESYWIEYCAGGSHSTGNDVINLSGLQDDAYYFLYIKADDENGKYISQEAVTLAQASVDEDEWWLFFYGDSDFQWADFEQVSTDDTIAKEELPHAGIDTIIALIGVMIIVVGAFSYIQYRKNNF